MTESRSDCKVVTSASLHIAFSKRVSSAKHLMVECLMQRYMSFMNIRKSIGPNTLPCPTTVSWGTPLLISAMIETYPSTTTV